MPQRRLPKSATALLKAMKTGKARKDTIPPPVLVPYSATTIAKLDLFYPAYKLKVEAMEAALQAQTAATFIVKETRQMAEWTISDFYSALQNAIRRKKISSTFRASYGLAANDGKIPVLNTEADITFWGDKAAVGEAARIAAGGAAITYPSIAEVNTAVTNFNNANLAQANAKEAYDLAQDVVLADEAEANKLVLKMWNETEAAFDTGNKPDLRRKSREWGVVYVPNPGEAPSPDDFSIIGKVTDSVTGAALGDVGLVLMPPDELITTESNGNFYFGVQPPATYSIHVHRGGYADKDITNIIVSAGAITTVNIQLTPVGSVSGAVTQADLTTAATITVDGVPGLSITTDPMGNYLLSGVPAGPQVIRATLVSNPAITLTFNVTVVAGGIVAVNFNF